MRNRSRRHALCAGLVLMAAVTGTAVAEDRVVGQQPEGWVERALFTSGISDREPVDELVAVDTGISEVYFFTELKQLAGRTVTHRWEYNGEVVSEMPFEVGGPRWRVFSKKSLLPAQTGKWTVVVVDESGWALHAVMFEYRPVGAAAATGVDTVESLPAETPPSAPSGLSMEPEHDPEVSSSPPPAPQNLRME